MQQNAPFDLKDFKDFKPPKISSGGILKVLIIFIVLVFLYSSWVTVNPEEVGVILRFGKYTRTVEPGLHFKLPLGIEKVYKVPVKRQLKLEFGLRTLKPGVRTQYSSRNYQEESLMLTGDLNAAQVEWI
ncbi:FtsH protease activity modulator HflK, partial [bacterium]